METRRGDPSSRRRLETRLLVKTGNDNYGLTYKWREDQSDADLVVEAGLDETLSIDASGAAKSQVWRYPSRNECRICHNSSTGHVLGFNAAQLNRPGKYGEETLNQIVALGGAGFFRGRNLPGVTKLPALSRSDDTAQTLDWRVRSYLAANCSYCHRPGGAGLGNFDARLATVAGSAGWENVALINNAGDAANRLVAPGDPTHSMLLLRIKGQGVPKMPPLGTSEIDPEGVRLLTEWILQFARTQ